MKVKRVTAAVLAALVVLSASASSQAVDTRAIDGVRSKGVLSNQDLKVIDVFLAEAVQELVDTRNFTDIARLRTIILSRRGSQGQYVRQFSESARKYIHAGLQRALTLEKDRTVKVTLNLLILIDGLSDMRLLDLSVSQLRSNNAVVRYWAVHSLTNPEIIKLLNTGGTATSQGAKFIVEKLMEIVNNSRPETVGLMAQFAAGVKIPQGEQLLLQIASARIKQYAAWKVEYELLDGAILRLMAGKMTSTNLNRSNVGSVFGQLYSCVIQRYVRGKEHLSDVQKHQLASVIVGTEAGCTGKLLGTPQTAMKRAVERGDDSALWAEHNRLLGEGSKAGQLPTKLNFTYGTGPGGKKLLAPMALPAPPRAKAESSFNEATSQVTKRIAPVLGPKKQQPVDMTMYSVPQKAVAERLKYEIKRALGTSNRNVARVSDIQVLGKRVIVYFAVNGNITKGLTKFGAKKDIEHVLKAIQSSGDDYSEVTLVGTFTLVDKFGKSEESKVLEVSYKRATVDKINWENFLTDNVYDIADSSWVHPEFR